jgi:hypothetical protein
MIWIAALLVCPVIQMAVGACFNRLSDERIVVPQWVWPVLYAVIPAHLVISVVASIAVVRVFRSWQARVLAWAIVAAVLLVALFTWWGAAMSLSGSVL